MEVDANGHQVSLGKQIAERVQISRRLHNRFHQFVVIHQNAVIKSVAIQQARRARSKINWDNFAD
jgi:hypothetical protein